jgi:hypothetical protein
LINQVSTKKAGQNPEYNNLETKNPPLTRQKLADRRNVSFIGFIGFYTVTNCNFLGRNLERGPSQDLMLA